MLDAWTTSIAQLHAPAAPAIDWPRDRRWLVIDGDPPRRQACDRHAVLAAVQAAGATSAAWVASAIGAREQDALQSLRELRAAGAVQLVRGRRWTAAES